MGSCFTGQYHEASIPGGEGLSYYNARWYDAKLGRFVSADTIVPGAGNPQSFNRYAYVLNNPLKYVDLSGHRPSDGCESESCSLPNGLSSSTTWMMENGAYSHVDPQILAAENYNPITQAVLPGLGMLVVGTTGGMVAADMFATMSGLAAAACADGDCTNEMQGVVDRGFGGDWKLFEQFKETLRSALPSDTRIAIRGSALTGQSWRTGRPFDALGPGSSDLDIVLVGKKVMSQWSVDAFYISGVNTMPLSDKTFTIAPSLNPVRVVLQQMVNRPVNFQAMPHWFLGLRRLILEQPYKFLD